MKVFASLLLLALAAVVAVQASVQPTPAPKIEKRQFDPTNFSQYTNPAAISSLSNYINSQFGSLESASLGPDMSSFLASQRSQAYSYLSVASSILANGGASNSDLSSVFGSITRTAASAFSSASAAAGSNAGAASAAGASATSSKAANAAVGVSAQVSGVMASMVACTFVAVMAGAFAL